MKREVSISGSSSTSYKSKKRSSRLGSPKGSKKSQGSSHSDPQLPRNRRIPDHAESFFTKACPWPLPAKGIDLFLLITVLSMVLFGLLMVYSSSFIYAQERTGDGYLFIRKQVMTSLLGLGMMFGLCRIDYRNWLKWTYPVVGASFFFLLAVLIVGAKAGGAQRWLRLGPVGFQPAEFLKVALVLFVARQLTVKQGKLHRFGPGFLSCLILPVPALILLLAQPDFGSAVIISSVIFFLMFLAGIPWRFLGSGLGLAVLGAMTLVYTSPYRVNRFMAFLDPWKDPMGKGFQILQSLVGLHNGAVFGVGLGNGKEKLFYLPEAHNDFIFAVIGEELGFIGLAAVVMAFSYFCFRGLKIAWTSYEEYGDRFGFYLASGLTLLLGLQGFVNMAVVLGMLPTKGLSLPFISYGGSALFFNLIAVGILLSIARGPQPKASKEPSFWLKVFSALRIRKALGRV